MNPRINRTTRTHFGCIYVDTYTLQVVSIKDFKIVQDYSRSFKNFQEFQVLFYSLKFIILGWNLNLEWYFRVIELNFFENFRTCSNLSSGLICAYANDKSRSWYKANTSFDQVLFANFHGHFNQSALSIRGTKYVNCH